MLQFPLRPIGDSMTAVIRGPQETPMEGEEKRGTQECEETGGSREKWKGRHGYKILRFR